MGTLEGRVAIVTGASSGIGRACALRFAEEGAAVVGFDRLGDRLREVIAEIETKGGVGEAVVGDVARDDDIDGAVATAAGRFGKIDILCNFAHGRLGEPGPLIDLTRERTFEHFSTGPYQSLRFMQRCFPYMK